MKKTLTVIITTLLVLLTLAGSVGFWGYIICAFIVPKKSDVCPPV